MANDYALKFRKSRAEAAAAPPPPAGETPRGVSTWSLALAAGLAGFLAFVLLRQGPGLSVAGLPSLPSAAQAEAPAEGPLPPAARPRVLSRVAGVTETAANDGRPEPLRYVAMAPVAFRLPERSVTVEGPLLLVPPLGVQRSEPRVRDHARKLAEALAKLAATPCDSHLRYVAAANVTLFVAAFRDPRTPLRADAPADLTFWSPPAQSLVRRAVHELAAVGALSLNDFGLDTSPEIKGLFASALRVQPRCG